MVLLRFVQLNTSEYNLRLHTVAIMRYNLFVHFVKRRSSRLFQLDNGKSRCNFPAESVGKTSYRQGHDRDFQRGRAGVCARKDSRQSSSAHKTFCGGRQSHPSADRFPKSRSCRIPPAAPTSAAHNDDFSKPAKCKNARYTDTLQFPDTAQDQQIVCRHTPAQSCNLHPLKYAPVTVFRAAHRAGSSFIQCHRLRIHRVCGRGHTF